MKAWRLTGLALLLAGIVLAFLNQTVFEAATAPTSVEVGIWLHGAPDITPITQLEQRVGVKFKAAKWYENWDDPWRPNIPNGYHSAGYTPEMSWQPMLKKTDGSYIGVANNDILRGIYDDYLDSEAANIKLLPYRLRVSMGNEFNGDWNPWGLGKVGNTTENHKLAWRYVVTRFKNNGVTNVDWIWTPNIDPDHTTPSFSQMYPGDAYVTYFGLDGYNFGTTSNGNGWRSFRSLYQSSYDQLIALGDKDIYIIEMGSVEDGGNKAEWIKEMFNDLPTHFPRIKGLTWWNVAYPQYDMRVETSEASIKQFRESINGTTDPVPASSGVTTSSNDSSKKSQTSSAPVTNMAVGAPSAPIAEKKGFALPGLQQTRVASWTQDNPIPSVLIGVGTFLLLSLLITRLLRR